MPKQQVVGEAGDPFEVVVGWSTETVQVGVETVDGRSIVTVLYGDREARIRIAQRICEKLGVAPPTGQTSDEEAEKHATLGRELLDIIEAEGDGGLSYTGLHASFGRSGTNELIKVERQARDKAFGKDQ